MYIFTTSNKLRDPLIGKKLNSDFNNVHDKQSLDIIYGKLLYITWIRVIFKGGGGMAVIDRNL